jgi:ribokinase
MDLVVRTPRHPQPGETILGSDFHTFPGGKGANQAVAAARLGAAVKMIGRVGEDSFGDSLLDNLRENSIDTTYISRDDEARTGVALITVSSSGENTIVVAPGANARLTPEDVMAAEDAFKGASFLLVQLESPIIAVAGAIHLAHKHGVPVLLNPAPARPLAASFLEGIKYVIPNQNELLLLTGMESGGTVPQAAKKLQSIYSGIIIVTLGEEGSLVIDGDQIEHLPSYRVDVVDTTAAGDAFVGAFAVALSQGHSVLESAKRGNAAGAIAATRFGAQTSLPKHHDIETFLSSPRHLYATSRNKVKEDVE